MSLSLPRDREALHALLVCPCCRARLVCEPGVLRCTDCRREFPQLSHEWVNLHPEPCSEDWTGDWATRQRQMEDWYRDLVANNGAVACFQIDYGPFASLLATYTGRILDVGGGIGVARHFLPAAADYIVVDPSLTWLDLDWTVPSREFPCLASPPCFVRGVGEQLPFRDGTFDSALAFWSLNHLRNPATVFCEVHRILAPNGRFLAVLEDMIPRWRDVLLPAHQACGHFRWPQIIARKARFALSGQVWPLQSDHSRILEEEIANWIAGRFRVVQRSWIARYLTFEFARV
jgi:SAM-dependent methyltransferase